VVIKPAREVIDVRSDPITATEFVLSEGAWDGCSEISPGSAVETGTTPGVSVPAGVLRL